jgi:hypothetical protein
MIITNHHAVEKLIAQGCFGLAYVAVCKYTRLSKSITNSLLKWQIIAFSVSALVQLKLMQKEARNFQKITPLPFVLIGFASSFAKATVKIKFISTVILSVGQIALLSGFVE